MEQDLIAAAPDETAERISEEPQRKPRARRELDVRPEFRQFRTGELRASQNSSNGLITVEGRVVVYGASYEVNDMWGSFTETIHQGACADLLQRDDLDVRFLFNHAGMPLARTGADASLEVFETDGGLDIRAQLDPRMSLAQDLSVAMERGLITQMSVGMEVDPAGDNWSGEDEYGMPNVRNIYRLANVFDTSAVTYPASPTTSIAIARSAWAGMPVESRERTRKLWSIARDIRAGREVSQAEADTLMHTLERLHSVDENSEERAEADEVSERPAPAVEEAPEAPEVEAPVEDAEVSEVKRSARLRMIDADLDLFRMRRPQR